MKIEFRALRADEVDVRIGTVKEGKGVSLLLYKDARCDMNILDETVGADNWQKSYCRDNANCIVSIWDDEKKQWISKEDTGTESNTEKEKGLASDSFKRSCVNWGIGRELYTAPFIWIPGADKNSKFWVMEMQVENHRITKLIIGRCDQWGSPTMEGCFTWPRQTEYKNPAPVTKEQKADEFKAITNTPSFADLNNRISDKDVMIIESLAAKKRVELSQICKRFNVSELSEMTGKQYAACMSALQKTKDPA